MIATYNSVTLRAPDAGKPVRWSGNARRIDRRSVMWLRKKMRHNVAERDANGFPDAKNTRVSSSKTSIVFVGNHAQALLQAKK
jgi:hypothetical protein